MTDEQDVSVHRIDLTAGSIEPFVRRNSSLLVPASLRNVIPAAAQNAPAAERAAPEAVAGSAMPTQEVVPVYDVPTNVVVRQVEPYVENTTELISDATPMGDDRHDEADQRGEDDLRGAVDLFDEAELPGDEAGPAQDAEKLDGAELERRKLESKRRRTRVSRTDELSRKVEGAEHRAALTYLKDKISERERLRRERALDDRQAQDLAALHRKAAVAGERARIRAALNNTGEMRALRIAMLQKAVLWIGIPVLLGFGAWSTAGVHTGLVNLFDLKDGSALWNAGWGLEPGLLTIVAGLILFKAIIEMSGGTTDKRIKRAEFGALGVSVLLNLVGGWNPDGVNLVTNGVQALGHAAGAIFAAVTAWLIGVLLGHLVKADPWKDAKRVSELNLAIPKLPEYGEPDLSAVAAAGGGPMVLFTPSTTGTVAQDSTTAAAAVEPGPARLAVASAVQVPRSGAGVSHSSWVPPLTDTAGGPNAKGGRNRSNGSDAAKPSRQVAAASAKKASSTTARIAAHTPRASGGSATTGEGLDARPRTRNRRGDKLRVQAQAPEN